MGRWRPAAAVIYGGLYGGKGGRVQLRAVGAWALRGQRVGRQWLHNPAAGPEQSEREPMAGQARA